KHPEQLRKTWIRNDAFPRKLTEEIWWIFSGWFQQGKTHARIFVRGLQLPVQPRQPAYPIYQLQKRAIAAHQDAISQTMDKVQRSSKLFEKAKQFIPGGVNSPVRAFRAVGGNPLFMKRAKGPFLYDEDGNEYVDLINSWGPMILGH